MGEALRRAGAGGVRRRDAAGIVGLSLFVSLSAVALATALGLPLGAVLAVAHFPGRRAVVVLLNALMGLPPVVVGLMVYLLLSRAGPLGSLGCCSRPARW
jgi:tungstate transport system permease protein